MAWELHLNRALKNPELSPVPIPNKVLAQGTLEELAAFVLALEGEKWCGVGLFISREGSTHSSIEAILNLGRSRLGLPWWVFAPNTGGSPRVTLEEWIAAGCPETVPVK